MRKVKIIRYVGDYDFNDEDWRDKIDNEDVLEMLEQEYELWSPDED